MAVRASSDLAIDLSAGEGPYARQIADQIRAAIARGHLHPGDRLPAARVLAVQLCLARGTVVSAFERLLAEGLVEARTGVGTFVSAHATPLPAPPTAPGPVVALAPRKLPTPDIDAPRPGTVDLRPCRPSTREFPRTTWRRCLANAAARQPAADYGDPRGPAALREAIAAYLRRARGYVVDAEHVVITQGSVHAMHLLAASHAMEQTTVVVEDPGYPLARQSFALAGATVRPCAVDADGLQVESLPRSPSGAMLVVVTPSHQFPTGARLSLGRRHHLVEWARQHGALIVEDDYDGEYRYDVPPLPPLAALAADCVVYCGTFSKTMFPGLRVGFAAGPTAQIDAMARYQALTAYAPGEVVHGALAEFIETGEFERHVHRMRKVYAGKRRLVTQTIRRHSLEAEVTGIDSGLNALVRLPPGRSAEALCEAAATRGVMASALTRYSVRAAEADDAIVMGYAEPEEEALVQGIACLLSTGMT